MSEEIKTRLNSIFADVFQDSSIQISDEMTTQDVERWDSLSHLTLIATIEDEFDIKFKLKELIAMKNVGDLINGVKAKSEN